MGRNHSNNKVQNSTKFSVNKAERLRVISRIH